MTARSYFGKMNSTLGSAVPLAMFIVPDVDLCEEEELTTRFRCAFGHASLFQLSATKNEFVKFLDDEQYSSLTKLCSILMGEMAHEF